MKSLNDAGDSRQLCVGDCRILTYLVLFGRLGLDVVLGWRSSLCKIYTVLVCCCFVSLFECRVVA